MTEANSSSGTSGLVYPSDILIKIWDQANIHDEETLRAVGNLTDHTIDLTRYLRITLDGIGCSVSSENQSKESKKFGFGYFEDGVNLSTLIFSITAQLDILQAMQYIGNEAEYRVREQLKARALRSIA